MRKIHKEAPCRSITPISAGFPSLIAFLVLGAIFVAWLVFQTSTVQDCSAGLAPTIERGRKPSTGQPSLLNDGSGYPRLARPRAKSFTGPLRSPPIVTRFSSSVTTLTTRTMTTVSFGLTFVRSAGAGIMRRTQRRLIFSRQKATRLPPPVAPGLCTLLTRGTTTQ